MSSPEHVVVIGGGLAGAKTVEALRDQGFEGAVTLIAAESDLPYERPPLSKGFLAGSAPFEEAVVHPQEWYTEHSIHLRRGERVTAIDPGAHQVSVDDGSTIGYDKLVLATGSVPRTASLPGAAAHGVHQLRTRADAEQIRAEFGKGRRLVIIGGGWIGLEVAATARGAETAVSVIEPSELPLARAIGPQVAAVYAEVHRAHGVDLRTSTTAAEILTEDGRATGVKLTDGEVIDADAVVIGIGAVPVVDLAESAGLAVDNGVLVDAGLRTSDPDIYAVGDIANQQHPRLGRRVRVEHWATALNQPAVAVTNLLGGSAEYDELPYFFSDQYDLGMEFYGDISTAARVVIRGDLEAREFVAFWLDSDTHITAVMNVNVWDVIDAVKPLILAGRVVDPAKVADPDVDYASL